MRFSLVTTAVGLFAVASLGCAQVTGIEDVSSSSAAQHCVDTVNMLRTGAGLSAVTPWLDEQQCADETALAFATNSSGAPPSCSGGNNPFSEDTSGIVDPDSYLQELANDVWSGGKASLVGSANLKQVACGYGATASNTAASLFLDPPF